MDDPVNETPILVPGVKPDVSVLMDFQEWMEDDDMRWQRKLLVLHIIQAFGFALMLVSLMSLASMF
jgi:predicted cobalt transporter CbtA